MFRSKLGSVLVLTAMLGSVALFIAACGSSSPEGQMLTGFFRAARVRDNATLANISATSFDVRTEGTVERFTVSTVGPEQRKQLQIKELAQQADEAKQADEAFAKKKKEYQDANIDAIQRVVKAEREKGKITGKDAEVQAAWTKLRDEQSQYTKKVSELRAKLGDEKSLAEMSLTPPGRATVDVTTMDVTLVSKDVTIEADVKSPEGTVQKQTMVVTLQQAIGKGADGKELPGRWIITSIKKSGAGQPVS